MDPSSLHDLNDHVLAAARRGDRRALRRLHDELAPAVLGYARGQGVEDPDVVANEAMYRALRDLHAFSGDTRRCRSWVFTIAHNLIVDEHRRRSRRPRTIELDRADPSMGRTVDASPAEAVADRIEAEEVVGLIGELAPDQRAVLLLRFIAELSIAETAEVVGKRPGAVKALQHRAVAALRRLIAARGVTRDAASTFTEVT